MKAKQKEAAEASFKDAKVKITTQGNRDLGAFIGTRVATRDYLAGKIERWANQINLLAKIAKTHPHAAHAGYVHGLRGKWVFMQRTMAVAAEMLNSLEKEINEKLIPAIFGLDSAVCKLDRDLFALPGRHSGMGIDNPGKSAAHHLRASQILSNQHVHLILNSQRELKLDEEKQKALKEQLKQEKEVALKAEYDRIYLATSRPMAKAMELAKEKGASALVTTFPIERHNLAFPRSRDFHDLLCLRYNKPVLNLPSQCVCGQTYTVDHSQQCLNGGFIHQRHNEAQELFAFECQRAGLKDIELEPLLLPILGMELESKRAKRMDGARSDVRVRGFWGNQQHAFFEFRVFYSCAKSYSSLKPAECYNRFESTRSAEYEERINKVDCGSFTPMVLSSSGGMGPRMSMALKHLAKITAEKTNQALSVTFALLRCRFVFCLLRSALVCLRGSRSIQRPKFSPASFDAPTVLAASESRLKI